MEFLEKETWEVIKTYFRDNKHYLIKHHLDSYNDFIMNKIPQTLKEGYKQIKEQLWQRKSI